jgi:hypothetical protein
LSAAFAGPDEIAHAMLVDPLDPSSLACAIRFGLTPHEPLLRIAGTIPRDDELAKMAAGDYRFQVDAVDPVANALGLSELDRQTRGVARRPDHMRFAQSASGHAFFLNGEFVAYAYAWPDGRIGPLASASEAYLVQIFAYALVTLRREYGASWCTALVPGSNRRIARTALRAGLRIRTSSLIARNSWLGDMSTYIAYHELLP